MEKICCIISAGDVNTSVLKEKKNEYSYFIAADLGFEKALLADITPSLLVGDFDSISQSIALKSDETTDFSKKYPNTHIIKFPVEKDFSDTHLAIEEGIRLGYKHFHIYGALGGDRFSHSIANLQTLSTMKSKNISVSLIGTHETVTLIENESVSLDLPLGCTFSVFSMTDISKDVTIEGAKYPLKNADLSNRFPLGVSNRSLFNTVTISVSQGQLLIICENL